MSAVSLKHPLVCIVGPTASGKTAVAQLVAEGIGASVLSADSMQVYRGMDIGTGKISSEDRTVAYYGIDIAEPGDAFSAALYQSYARDVVESIDDEGGRCVVCGGTGFYVRALIDEFDFPAGEQVGNELRDTYHALLLDQGPLAVWKVLDEKDHGAAATIPPNDSKRVIRALELHEQGISYADQRKRFSSIGQHYAPVVQFGLSVDPAVLAGRIERRVDAMFDAGLVDEVRSLIDKGYREAVTARHAIGYKEVAQALDGHCSMADAANSIKQATRRYAKRQRTWFGKDSRIEWVDATDGDAERVAESVFKRLEEGEA